MKKEELKEEINYYEGLLEVTKACVVRAIANNNFDELEQLIDILKFYKRKIAEMKGVEE